MDINKLRIFLTIIDHGSFNKAARQLGYTQAGLTYIIDGLEEELGLKLLQRTHRGVKLTEDGASLLVDIHKIVRATDAFDSALSTRKQSHGNCLHIGTIDTMSIKWLPEATTKFAEKYPNVNVDAIVGDPFEINEWVNDGIVDIGLTEHYWADAELSWVDLVRDRYYGVFPSDMSDLKNTHTCTACDFERHDFFLFDFRRERNVPIIMQENKAHVNFRSDILSNTAILTQVSKGRGVTIASALSIDTSISDNLRQSLNILPLEPESYRSLGMLFREEYRVNKNISYFIRCMKDAVRADNSWQDQRNPRRDLGL